MPRIVSALVIAAFVARPAFSAERIPLEAFAENGAIEQPALSPDGTQIAYLTSSGSQRAIADYHLDTGKGEVLCMVDGRTNELFWKDNRRILFTTPVFGVLYLRSVSPGAKSINTFKKFGDRREILAVENILPSDPDHILVRGAGRTGGGRIGIMDVETGDIEDNEPVENSPFVGPYIPDNKGTLRLRCIQLRADIELQHRQTDHDDFKTVHTWTWEEPLVRFGGFGSDAAEAYFVTHTDHDSGELRTFDTRTATMGPPIATFAGYDIAGPIFSWDHSSLIGVAVEGTEGREARWLDGGFSRMQAIVNASLPGRENLFASWSRDGKTFVILSTTEGSPGEYFAFSPARRMLIRLGQARPALNPALLARPKPYDIKTRDGFTIHAVLTAPPMNPTGPWPLIVCPLSDPFEARSSCAFDGNAQFLASRGYATLKVDYRGAWGYGWAYEKAGYHEFAGRILDDIEDATRWAVQSGYAKPGRIAIMGEGIGASLAMICAVQSPDTYCCVVNDSGFPELSILTSDDFDWLTRKHLEIEIGPDSKALARVSVLDSVDRLKAPILNIYANPDRNLIWAKLEARLRMHGKKFVEFKPLEPSVRPLVTDLRKNYLTQLEDFLKANLPPGS